jgi:hypothetical protein
MTGSTGVAPQDQVEGRASSGTVAWTVLRVAGSAAALVALYYLLPLDHSSTPAAVTMCSSDWRRSSPWSPSRSA